MGMIKVIALLLGITFSLLLYCFAVHAQLPNACPSDFESRLRAGEPVRVSPGDSNRVRSEPTTASDLLGILPGEYVLLVIDGPACADGYVWWQIITPFSDGSLFGWTVEGQGDDHWLIPMDPDRQTCEWTNAMWDDVSLTYFWLAHQASNYGYDEAVILFSTCQIATNPEVSVSGYLNRGEAQFRLGNYSGALADMTYVIELGESQGAINALAYVDRARVYLAMGEYQVALDDVNRVLNSQDPNQEIAALVVRGETYHALGDYTAAEADFQTAIQDYEAQSMGSYPPLEARLALGALYADQNRYPEAIEQYYRAAYGLSKIHARTPADFAPLTLGLAEAYDGLGFLPQALGAYELYWVGIEELEAEPDARAVRRREELRAQEIESFTPALFPTDKSTLTEFSADTLQTVFSAEIPPVSWLCGLIWSPDGEILVANNQVFEPDSSPTMVRTLGSELPYRTVFLPDNRHLLAAYPESVKLWDVTSGQMIDEWEGRLLVSMAPNGERFATLDTDTDGVTVRDMQSGRVEYTVPFPAAINDIAFSPNGTVLAIVSGEWQDHTFWIVDADDGSLIHRLNAFNRIVNIDFSPDGSMLALVERDVISLWDVQSGTLLGLLGTNWQLTEEGDVAFRPDGAVFAATRGEQWVLYETQTGAALAYGLRLPANPTCLSFHPDGNQIAAILGGWMGQTVFIWEIEGIP